MKSLTITSQTALAPLGFAGAKHAFRHSHQAAVRAMRDSIMRRDLDPHLDDERVTRQSAPRRAN